jgi:hypothetical protein
MDQCEAKRLFFFTFILGIIPSGDTAASQILLKMLLDSTTVGVLAE